MSQRQWRKGKYFPDKTGKDWDRTELRHKVDDDVYSQILRVTGDVNRTVEDDVADINAHDVHSFDYERDLRDLRTYTIDPVNAKDYDDAISIEQDGDRYRAYVHIANVAQQINGYDQVRETALEQGRTFYFEHETDHMLPADLAEQFSLLKDEDRLAFTVEFEVAPVSTASGERLLPVGTPDIYPSLVNVDANLSYTNVATRDTGLTSVSKQSEIDERLDDLSFLSEYSQRWKPDRWKAEEHFATVDTDTALYDFAEISSIPIEFPVEVRRGSYEFDLTGTADELDRLQEVLDTSPLDYELLSLVRTTEADGLLTDRQREILELAVRQGYYEVPRASTLTDLADALDVDKSTVSTVIRRGEAQVISWFLSGAERLTTG